MLLSKTCIYSIRAILLIASKCGGQEYISTRSIADELGISFHFLAKITQILGEANLVKSYRGPNGGIGLARDAAGILLMDIIEATDGTKGFDECLLGLPSCNADDPCPLHGVWQQSREHLLTEFKSKCVKDIIGDSVSLRLRA